MLRKESFTGFKKMPLLPGILIIIFIFAAYIPALNIYLRTDDFEWLNSVYKLWQHPSGFFSPIGYFFRPMVKLSYLLNYTLFGTNATFYAATTILIHLGNVFLIYILILKITRRIIPASLISLCYGVSPLYSEVTLWAAGRPDSIMLLFVMGALILVFNSEKPVTTKGSILLLMMGIGAAFSKETWIILPFLILTILIIIKRYSVKDSIKHTLGVFFLVIIYLFVFVTIPLISGNLSPSDYASFDLRYGIEKAGYLLFSYAGFGNSYSGETWQLFLIALLLLGFLLILLVQKNRLALLGMVWMILFMIPSLPIQGTPSRYNYLPLLGFWIMVIVFFEKGINWLSGKIKIKTTFISITVVCVLIFLLSHQVIMLQWEIKDYKSFGDTHKKVVDMYNRIKEKLPLHQPIVFLNAGTKEAVHEASQSVEGYSKLFFVRSRGIWQLVLFPQLANFAGKPFQNLMVPVPPEEIGKVIDGEFKVIVFSDNGFYFPEKYNPSIKEYYNKFKQLPKHVQVVQFINIK